MLGRQETLAPANRGKGAPPLTTRAPAPFTFAMTACLVLVAFIVALGCIDRAIAQNEGSATVHVSYQWYGDDAAVTEDYEIFDVEAAVGDATMRATVMGDVRELGEGCSWRVMKNFAGGVAAGEQDISSEASYDEGSGVLSLPASRAGENVTVVFTLPWDHPSHSTHGHFNGQAHLREADPPLSAQGGDELGTAGFSGLEAGTVYPLAIVSGENGLESDPAIYAADTDATGAGTVMGYPEFDGCYKFYVVWTMDNCELFQIVGDTPGRWGNGGIIYGGTGTPYDYTWAKDFKWCSADCVENVYNGAGMPVPLNGDGSWIRIDSVSATSLECTFRLECNNPDGTNAQDIMGTFSLQIPKGALALQKGSSDGAITDGNACYSLAGAKYGVFESREAAQARDAAQALATYVTDEAGAWESGNDFFAGTYYIAELEPPEGYALNEDILSATVDAGEVCHVRAYDDPLMGPASARVQKRDAATGAPVAQGDATLEGAEVTFRYYDGYYDAGNLPGEPTRTWVMRTTADGEASPAHGEGAKVAGDDFYRTKAGDIAFPLGTVTATETKAPEGYLLDSDETLVVHITADDATRSVSVRTVGPTRAGSTPSGAAIISDSVQSGRLIVGKVSRENGGFLEQGAASLEGWAFEIVNASARPIVVDGATFGPGEVVKTITTRYADGSYVADTGEQCLPFGSYEVREVQTSRPQDIGYLFDGASAAWSRAFTIREGSQTVSLVGGDACSNQVVRGDLEFSKVKSPSMERLAGIPFKITSTTTGEWHVIVTDRNAYASTSAGTYAHTSRTNANDAALNADGSVNEALLDDEAGIWFSGRADAPVGPDDGKGALPFDTYTVQELRVAANEGLDLITVEATVYRDGATVNLGTLEDTAGVAPRIGTTLSDAEGNKVVAAQAGALLIDQVAYNNLDTSETYALAGELYLVEDGQATALLATAETAFTPSLSHGAQEMAFELDTSQLGGASLVCFEYLSDSRGNGVASHADASDEGQTVSVPAIGTTLADAATGEHCASLAGPDALQLVDTVTYEGLAPNRTYTVTGTLHDGATGEPLLNAAGQPIVATRSFTPRDTAGSVELAFSFALERAAGTRIVAFESLACRGVEYAVHADLEDEGQTVTVPSMGTELADAQTAGHVTLAADTFTLTDTVAYEGLVPGKAYTLTGVLFDKATGEPAPGEDGAPITGTATFTPAAPNGTAEVPFEFSAKLAGRTLVAFETLEADGRTYAVHADLEDDAQTVYVPLIHTTLLDAASESHLAGETGPYTLVDTITFEGLLPGQAYTATGTLHDAETGKALVAEAEGDGSEGGKAEGGAGGGTGESGEAASAQRDDGSSEADEPKGVTARAQFTPAEPSGTVDVTFELDAELAGRTVVAFEEVADSKGNVVATHADLDDAGQSVSFPIPPEPEPEPSPLPDNPVTRGIASALAPTGDSALGVLLFFIPAGALGLALAALSVRRLEREKQIVIQRGKPQL